MPLYGARADGLFADHGLDVEFVASPPGSGRVKALASGHGDFLLTALLYYLQALDEDGPLDVRVVAAVHQRSSMAALVRRDSDITAPADLDGRRLGGPHGSQALAWLLRECRAELARGGVTEVEVVPRSYRDAARDLRTGLVEAIPNLAELGPLVARALDTPLRAVPVGSPIYLSGLVAGSWVADDVVDRMRAALRQALASQRDDPTRGVDLLRSQHPAVNGDDAVDSWSVLAAFALGDDAPAAFDEERWRRTVEQLSAVHGLRAASVPTPT